MSMDAMKTGLLLSIALSMIMFAVRMVQADEFLACDPICSG